MITRKVHTGILFVRPPEGDTLYSGNDCLPLIACHKSASHFERKKKHFVTDTAGKRGAENNCQWKKQKEKKKKETKTTIKLDLLAASRIGIFFFLSFHRLAHCQRNEKDTQSSCNLANSQVTKTDAFFFLFSLYILF